MPVMFPRSARPDPARPGQMRKPLLRKFSLLNGLTLGSGCAGILLLTVWLGSYQAGFTTREYRARRDPEMVFSWHPVIMASGPVLLLGQALLVYRLFRKMKCRWAVILHVGGHCAALLFLILGLVAAFESRNLSRLRFPPPHLHSLHSWLGIAGLVGFVLQIFIGAFFYLGSGLSDWRLLGHKVGGLCVFATFSVTALMGIVQYSAWKVGCETCAEATVAKCAGLGLFVYSGLVIFMVSWPRFRRRNLAMDDSFASAQSHSVN